MNAIIGILILTFPFIWMTYDAYKELKKDRNGEKVGIFEAFTKGWNDTKNSQSEEKPAQKFVDLGSLENTVIWTEQFVKSLEWKRFEEVCAEFLKIKNYNAGGTCIGADGGIDIKVQDENGLIIAIAQCKAFDSKQVGVALIRELFGIMASEKVEQGLFFTTSTFSDDAVEFAKNNNITLIDLKSFVSLVNALNGDSRKRLYDVSTQGDFTSPTCVRCNIKLVKRVARETKKEFWGCPNFPKCKITMNVRA
jgi:restriction system protein